MKPISLGVAAVAGLAFSASGQSVTLTFSASETVVAIGDTVSWTVSASFDGFADPSAYFGGFVGSFASTGSMDVTLSGAQNLMSFQATTPVINGNGIDQINIFQAALLGSDDNSNPLDIFSFQARADSVGFSEFAAAGVATVFPDDGIFTLGQEFAAFDVVSDRVVWVPAPGVALAFACGVAVATTRRR